MRMTHTIPLTLATVLLLSAACSTSSSEIEASADSSVLPDVAAPEDSGSSDTSLPDTGPTDTELEDTAVQDTSVADTESDALQFDAADTGTPDIGPDDAGPQDIGEPDASDDVAEDVGPVQSNLFGEVTGVCGAVAAELSNPNPSFLLNTYAFDEAFDAEQLSAGPKKRFDLPNAGGSSKCTEVMSLQLLIDCEGAALFKTENEVVYDAEGSLTDYVVSLDGERVGVSVTRAYLGPVVMDYSVSDAQTLLTKKLEGVNEATANVSEADVWVKQVLHIWTLQPTWVPMLEEAWESLSAELKADTIILVTVETQSTEIVTDSCDD